MSAYTSNIEKKCVVSNDYLREYEYDSITCPSGTNALKNATISVENLPNVPFSFEFPFPIMILLLG